MLGSLPLRVFFLVAGEHEKGQHHRLVVWYGHNLTLATTHGLSKQGEPTCRLFSWLQMERCMFAFSA